MKTSLQSAGKLAACAVSVFLMNIPANAQLVWTNGGTDLLWTTPANWSPAGPPGPSTDLQFQDAGATNDAISINNIVPASIQVQSVLVAPTTGTTTTPANFNTLLNPGATLAVGGTETATTTYRVGTLAYVNVLTTVTNTVTGPGATLLLDNTNNNLIVREGNGSSGDHLAVLDLSGLDTFNASLGRILVGVGDSSYRRAMGDLVLARTNHIELWAGNPELLVGDNSGNNNGNGSVSYLVLGQSNTIFANTVRIGGQKQQGNLSFSSAYTNPSLLLRGSDGVSPVSEFGVGDESAQGSSGNPTTGRVDLSSGTADILANTVYVGRGQSGSGASATGYLTLGSGTFDVNAIEIAYQNAASAANPVNGTLTLNGTTTTVNDVLRLGRSAGAPPARNATLNLTGGSLTVVSNFVIEGTAYLGFTNAVVSLPAKTAISADTLTVDGTTLNNVSVLQVTNILITANGGTINGVQSYDLGTNGTAIWYPQNALFVTNSLSGAGTIYADVDMLGGSTLSPGGPAPGVLSIAAYITPGNLSLHATKLALDLSSLSAGGNDSILASGSLSLSGTNDVRITAINGSLDTTTPYTLINYYGTLTGDASNFQVTGPLAQSRYTFAFSTLTPNTVTLSVGGTGSANLLWVGDGLNNTWNLNGAANWLNGAVPDKFYNLDSVTFDDSGSATPAVNLAGTLLPSSITLSNVSKTYVFSGSGALGGTSLTNYGSGGLVLANDGTNSFSMIDVEAGPLTLGGMANNSSSGGLNINSGASVLITNSNDNDFGPGINLNGSLVFNQSLDAVIAAPITGMGPLTKNGDNVLTLSGNNNGGYFGVIQVNGGTLRAGSANILSSSLNTFASGASLDVNGFNLGAVPVTVSGAGTGGQGAIVNNSGNPAFIGPNLAFVTLAGDTTFGGTGRWDLRSPGSTTGDPSTAGLITGGQPFNLTKVGTNAVNIVTVAVDPALANIDIQQGVLSWEGNTTGMGDPSKTLTVESGATLQFYRPTNAFSKQFVLFGDGTNATVNNASGSTTIAGPMTLNGNCVFNVGGTSLTNTGPLSGPGSLIKQGGNTLVLATANTYGGATLVNAGTLEVDGSIAGSGVDVEAGTLSGLGSVTASVLINTNANLSPGGGSTATLTISSDLTLAGNLTMDVNKTGTAITSDQVANITHLTLGGTLTLNLTGDTLAAGDAITLFAAASGTGAFVSITPPTPGTGLRWDASELASSGRLKVATSVTSPPRVDQVGSYNGSLVLSGSGGTPSANYVVLTSANLAQPISAWTPVVTNQFDASGNFTFTNAMTAPQQYFILELQQ